MINTKFLIAILVIGVSCIGIWAVSVQTRQPEPEALVYKSEDYGFEIAIPRGWTHLSGYEGMDYYIVSFYEEGKLQPFVNWNIIFVKVDLEPDPTLILETFIERFHWTEEWEVTQGPATIAGKSGWKDTARSENYVLKKALVVHNQRGYCLEVGCLLEDLGRIELIFEKFVEGFKFTLPERERVLEGGTSFEDAISIVDPTFAETRRVEEARSVYYKFLVDNGGSFKVEIEDNDLVLVFYNPDRSEDGRCEIKGFYGITNFAESSGHHYVEVQCARETRYEIIIRVAQLAKPGQTFETATKIVPGVKYEYGTYEGALGRVEVEEYEHYYKFYLKAERSISLRGKGSFGEVEWAFLSPDGSYLDDYLIWRAEVSGEYRLRVTCKERPIRYDFILG